MFSSAFRSVGVLLCLFLNPCGGAWQGDLIYRRVLNESGVSILLETLFIMPNSRGSYVWSRLCSSPHMFKVPTLVGPFLYGLDPEWWKWWIDILIATGSPSLSVSTSYTEVSMLLVCLCLHCLSNLGLNSCAYLVCNITSDKPNFSQQDGSVFHGFLCKSEQGP